MMPARLCVEARDRQIPLSPRAFVAVEGTFDSVLRGEPTLNDIQAPIDVHNVIGKTDP